MNMNELKKKILAAGEVCRATFWSVPEALSKEGAMNSSGFSDSRASAMGCQQTQDSPKIN